MIKTIVKGDIMKVVFLKTIVYSVIIWVVFSLVQSARKDQGFVDALFSPVALIIFGAELIIFFVTYYKKYKQESQGDDQE